MSKEIDNPQKNDNRNYLYPRDKFYFRGEFPIICDWIENNSKVIDLGCGNGSLMKYILDRKKVEIDGIEISGSGVEACKKNNLRAIVGEIDKAGTYKNYSDNQFGYAICNVTIQMVMHPEVLVKEMKRIAKNVIISFPNFAYIGNRFDLLLNGRMPKPMMYGYEWYNTGHVHQLSVEDFKNFCLKENIIINRQEHLGFLKYPAKLISSNLFSKIAIYLCGKY
jgi:methionine biosynthesis protein MetW